MARKATLTSLITGEFKTVERGTEDYYKLVQEGWLSREQVSHRTPQQLYPEEYTPDYIEEPEEEPDTEYPAPSIRDILEDRLQDMYDTIRNILDDLPFEKQFYDNPKHPYVQDTSEQRFYLLQLLDDLYGQSEDESVVNKYLLDNQELIADLTMLVVKDSESGWFEQHISQLAVALNHGNALTPDQAQELGDQLDSVVRYDRASDRAKHYKRF